MENKVEIELKKTKTPFSIYKIWDVSATLLSYLLLILIAILVLMPIIWIIGASLNEGSSLMSSTAIPKNPTLSHYKDIFLKTKFGYWYLNTLKIAVANMAVSVLLTTTTAYVYARFNFKGKKSSLLGILVLQMFPSFMGMIAMYNILWQLNLLDNHWGLILVYASGQIPFNTWLVKGYLSNIPKSLDEAAMIDGASKLRVFFSIILPLARPIMVFLALTQFMAPWMDFIFPRLILSSNSKKTLAIGLYDLISGSTNTNFTNFAAGAVLVAIPSTLIFMYFQKYFIEGILAGASKG
ncbi:sugar ABC transporter permease [Clostridium thermarum]|uniref:sugar ABC transporter permease n=1 Tax=Clostridium thermarum TaxID=1716543 RepID=UPI0013D6B06B|nr:sugar ABC transporter permease [Clostridium thermarum]